jgi:hypothetical protein
VSLSCWRAVAAACSLVAVLIAVVVPAASWADDAPVAASPSPDWAKPVGPDVLQGAAALELRQEQARNAALMPQSIDARRDSASQYRDLSRSEAAGVLQDTQPGTVADLTYPKVNLEPGQDLTMVSPTRAEITSPDGSTDLAVSTQPFGFPDASGDLTPVDLDLEKTAAGFSITASPVPTVLPETLDDPLAIGSGGDRVNLVPHGAVPVAGVKRDTGVFYANIDTDTDLFVKPVVGGVETFHLLRSADSPETVALDLQTGDGTAAHLVEDPTGAGAVLETADATIGAISPPKAVDADGRSVPVEMTLDGATLSMHVSHRGADFAYPITVDPVYISTDTGCWDWVREHQGCQIDLWETNYGDKYGDGGGAGWTYSESDAHGLINGYFSTNTAYLGMGLTIAETGYNHFDDLQGGNWSLGAPGEVVIFNAGFYNVTTDNWDNNSCAFTGLRRNDGSWDNGVVYVGSCAQQTVDQAIPACWNGAAPTLCSPPASPASAMYGNRIWFGSITNGESSTWGWTHGFTHVLGGAVALMHDYVPPRYNVRDYGGSTPVTVTLGEFGLGMKSWSIYSDGHWVDSWDDNSQPAGVPRCSGGVSRFVCPHDVVRDVSRCDMWTGTNIVSIDATDVSGNHLLSNVGVYVDPSITGFTLSGELATANGQTLANRAYALHVDAHAPCGVNEISAQLDGQNILPFNYTNSRDEVIDVSRLAPGSHTLTINARGKSANGGPSASWMGAKVITFTKAGAEDDDPLGIDDDEMDLPVTYGYVPRSGATVSAAYKAAFAHPGGIQGQATGQLPRHTGGPVTVPLTTAGHRWLGLSDQKDVATTDPALTSLNVPYRRLIVPYDAVIRANPSPHAGPGPVTCAPSASAESNYNFKWLVGLSAQYLQPLWDQETTKVCDGVKRIDAWMAANNGFAPTTTAGGEAVQPLVSFGHTSADYAYYSMLKPSTTYYRAAIAAFRARYPNVKFFTPWNEPNNRDQPYRTDPVGAAARLHDMQLECNNVANPCYVLAGDFADGTPYLANGKPNTQSFNSYLVDYQDGYRNAAGNDWTGAWAMHLHSSIQDRYCPQDSPSTCHSLPKGSMTKLNALLTATKAGGWTPEAGPPVWITEVGAITDEKVAGKGFDNPQARVEASFVNALTFAASNPRIKRMYYYHLWGNGPSDPDGSGNWWDSGLLAPISHAPRQLYDWYSWIAAGGDNAPQVTAHPLAVTSSTTATFSFASQSVGDGFECRLDDGAWATCSSPTTYSAVASGTHTFEVQATQTFAAATPDSSFTGTGIIGKGRTLADTPSSEGASSTWTVDVGPPETSLVSGPSGPTGSTSASFTLGGSDDSAVTAYECRLDGGAWEACTTTQSYTDLAAGAHTFAARAQDAIGNVDASPATASWSVDVVAPSTSIVSSPFSPTASTTGVVTFDGDDDVDVDAYECRLDDGDWAACTSPRSFGSLAQGSHTVLVRAVDTAGNADATPATAAWTVDLTAPETSISAQPASASTSTSASFSFAGSDDVAVVGYECQLDAGTWAACASPKSYASLAAGSHTFKVRSLDGSGNVDGSPSAATWTVDTTAPTTTIGTAPSGSTTATTASIVFTGGDNVAVDSYECQLDAGAWAACASPKSYGSLASGSHTFKVRAKDAAGNVDASPATATWTVTTSAGSVLLGNQTIEAAGDYNPAYDVEAFPFTATASGSAASIAVYLDGDSSGAVALGLYANSAGRPAKLLASGTIASPTPGAWNTVALDGRPLIVSGTTYHLSLQSATGGIKFRDRAGGPCTAHLVSPGQNVVPKQWPATDAGYYSTCPASVYVNAGAADTTAPETSISAQPGTSTAATSASLAFTVTDDYGTTGAECRIDGSSWTACLSPRGYGGLAVGSHTFEVRGSDAAGNVDATPASATWTVVSGAVPTQLAGNSTVETHAEPIAVGRGQAWPATATATGIAGTMSIYLDSSSTAGELQVGLYANNTNKPGALLASGTTSGQSAGGWATVALSGSVAVVTGTPYWLGVMSNDPTVVVRDRQSGTCTAHAINTPLGAFPNTWTTDIATTTRCPASMTLSTN